MKQLGLLFAVCLGGCTQDFDAFAPLPESPAGSDGGASLDAGTGRETAVAEAASDAARPDAGGPTDAAAGVDACGSSTCLTDAKTCADACTTTSQDCQTACGNNNPCKNNCKNELQSCKGKCGQTCNTCIKNGCATFTQCVTAVQ